MRNLYPFSSLLLFAIFTIPATLWGQNESEPNNTFTEADAIEFGQLVSGAISIEDDRDYYQVEITEPGVLIVRMKNIPVDITYAATIYNANQQELERDLGSNTNPIYEDRLICNPGIYYIEIEGEGRNDFSSNQYELTVSFDNSDQYECNNGFTSAASIPANGVINASIFDGNDEDYFQIELTSPGVLTATLRNIPEGQRYNLELFSQNQQPVGGRTVATSARAGDFTKKICTPGTYYLKIDGRVSGFLTRFNSPEPYELELSYYVDDVYECNDAFGDAIPINPCTEVVGSIFPSRDEDYYQIEIEQAGDYFVTLRDVPANISARVEILDEFGESLGSEGSATEGASVRLDFSVPASGNYFVKVSDPVVSGIGGEASPDLYTLTFAPGIPCAPVPEICNNGQDDDGDGLVDCEDRNCFNFSGCTNSGNDCANVNISLTETITPESCDGNDGIISLSASGGAGPYTYAWSNNASGNRITGLAQGSYSVTTTDANGCTTVQSFTVTSDCTNDPCATVNISITDNTTPESCDGNDGAITLSVSGGSAPYTYAWNDGSGGSNRSALTQGTYTVTVTDLNGCSTSESFTIANNCSSNNECSTASFEIQNQGGGTYFFRNTSTNDPDVVFWQFGDGAENALDYSPTHTYNSSGTYEVTLVVAKNCGIEAEEEDTTRQTLTVTLGNEPLIVLGNAEGAIGETVLLPVIAVNFNMTLASLQGIVDIADPTVGQIQGVEGGLIGDFQSFLFNVNNGRFSFFNSSNNEIQLGQRDTLFYLQILLQGEDDDMSAVTLGGNNAFPLEVSDTDFNFSSPPTEDGKVTIVNNFRLDGRIATYWDAAIPNVNISMQASLPDGSTQNDNQTSDTEGSYLFEEVPAGSACVITPEKNTNVTNGLAAAALFAAQRFIIGFDVPQISSPFQIVAGDANCDGRLSTVDLFIIQKVQVGIDPAFPGCPSWVFVPAAEAPNFRMSTLYYPNYPYPREANLAAINEDTSVDFIGVKVGDILGRANPEALRGTPEIEMRSNATAPLVVRADYLPKKQQVRYQLLTPIEQSLASFQFSLGYDAERMVFLRAATNAELGDAPLIGQRPGVLNLSWFSASGQAIEVAEGFVIQTLFFNVEAPLADPDQAIWLYDRGLPPIMHDADLQGTTIALQPAPKNPTISNKVERAILYQNQPNPFRQNTQIRFYLPQAAKAQLVIRNALGKTVWQRFQQYPAGEQRETVNLNLTPGMYFYTLETEKTTLTKSMIVK